MSTQFKSNRKYILTNIALRYLYIRYILFSIDFQVFVTLGIHVAGSKDFPDSIANKPWKNSDPKVSFYVTTNL